MSIIIFNFLLIILVIVGTIVLIKDAFGESIEAAAEAIAVNSVAVKINKSLEEGFYDEELSEPSLTSRGTKKAIYNMWSPIQG